MRKLVVVDIEADGPIPHDYSMVCFGACIVDDKLDKTFYGTTKPISDKWIPDALAISGFSREEHLKFDEPDWTMEKFKYWLKAEAGPNPIFIADNLAFDWQWINWYFHHFLDGNPFGFSGRRINDLFHGYYNDMYFKWKKFRKTTHDHNPVNDAIGNAEALLYLKSQGFKLKV